MYALALAAQAAQPETGSGQLSTNTDIIRLISSSSWLSIGVLAILLLFSAIGWGITLYLLGFGLATQVAQIQHVIRHP